MSRVDELERLPLIALVHRANRVFQDEMMRQAHEHGHTELRASHNAVFTVLSEAGARTSDMAQRAGITKQSMGEVVREMVSLGILEMNPDPEDRRAKIVSYTDYGLEVARGGTEHLIRLERDFEERFGEDYEIARDVVEQITRRLLEGGDTERSR